MKNIHFQLTRSLKQTVALLFFIAAAGIAVNGQDTEALAVKARKAYDAGKFDQSIQIYEKILAGGLESSVLYYNLGNAYFRNKEIPSALLFYEKALKLDPNNEDIRHNIAISNTRITDKVENVPELFYKRWWKALINSISLDTLGILIILLFVVALVLLGIYLSFQQIHIRKFAFYASITLFIITIIALYAAGQKEHYLQNEHEAIVFTPTVTVKSSPDAASTDLFVIHEGLKVTLLDKIGDWQEIRIANGSIGWLKDNDIRKI